MPLRDDRIKNLGSHAGSGRLCRGVAKGARGGGERGGRGETQERTGQRRPAPSIGGGRALASNTTPGRNKAKRLKKTEDGGWTYSWTGRRYKQTGRKQRKLNPYGRVGDRKELHFFFQ